MSTATVYRVDPGRTALHAEKRSWTPEDRKKAETAEGFRFTEWKGLAVPRRVWVGLSRSVLASAA